MPSVFWSCSTAWRWEKVPRSTSCPEKRTCTPSLSRLPETAIAPTLMHCQHSACLSIKAAHLPNAIASAVAKSIPAPSCAAAAERHRRWGVREQRRRRRRRRTLFPLSVQRRGEGEEEDRRARRAGGWEGCRGGGPQPHLDRLGPLLEDADQRAVPTGGAAQR